MGILEDQEPDEERIHEKNLERTEGRIHEIVRKRMEEWFHLKKEFQTDQERRGERKHGRKRNGYKWIQGTSGK